MGVSVLLKTRLGKMSGGAQVGKYSFWGRTQLYPVTVNMPEASVHVSAQ